MNVPGTSISLRISFELWTKIKNFAEKENSPDFSHAVRALIEAGLWLDEHKMDLSDPKKSQKIIEEYNEKSNEEHLFSWIGQLSDSQIEGMKIALELEKEKRITLQ